MRQLIVSIAMLISVSAAAELKLAQKQIPIYLSGKGEQLSPVDAVKHSIAGERVLKCEVVEAQASETGNVSLKKKK